LNNLVFLKPFYPNCENGNIDICNDPILQSNENKEATSFNTSYMNYSRHGKYSFSKHNILCNREGGFFAMIDDGLKNRGFDKSNKFSAPKFNYFKKELTRYVVLIDETREIEIRYVFSNEHF
jgi:hypothetical protein